MIRQTQKKVLDYAITLAIQTGAKLKGIHVIPVMPYYSRSFSTAAYQKLLLSDAKKMMKKAEAVCSDYAVNFSFKILHGVEGDRIVSYANNHDFDGIVIGATDKGKLEQMFLGSTSNHVVNKAKIPVIIVK